MRKQRASSTTGSKQYVTIVMIVIVLIFAVSFIRKLKNSLFFNNPDRLNILIYNKDLQYYSLGLRDNVHYVIRFYPDLKLLVPGGYGYYRVGAISKLAQLENNPKLFQKTFSLSTSTFTDFYFYPKNESTIEYGTTITKDFHKPSFGDIFQARSNAGLLNKLYIYFLLSNKSGNDFKEVLSTWVDTPDHNFNQEKFLNDYQGYFYQYSFRQEKKNVQIIYENSYTTAVHLGKLLEGNGVRVSDLTERVSDVQKCQVIEKTENYSLTAKKLANFFGCQIKTGETGFYDIIFELGDLEKEWEIN